MKYRIKQTTTKGGVDKYYPQYKYLFRWYKFTIMSTNYMSMVTIEPFDTLGGAQSFIDRDITTNTLSGLAKVVKVKIHQYPSQ